MSEQIRSEKDQNKSQIISLDQTRHFVREGFEGFDYGDGTMLIKVDGKHPLKRIDSGKRSYIVAYVEGYAEFTLNNETHPIKQGDKFTINPGSEYRYRGENMILIELNEPGTKDTKLETK